ncbi:SCP2 sterol-binding domain-containing protein [Syncephalis fuscata]|nr:SCP2 sterol-binding domain-containing protein [Syncephalis fuscata]
MSATAIFKQFDAGLASLPDSDREKLVKDTKAIFVFDVKTAGGQVKHTLNLKDGKGSSAEGAAAKSDITISVDEKPFVELASGKLKGQQAFMKGIIKIKGNMMTAMKLDKVLAQLAPPASKL